MRDLVELVEAVDLALARAAGVVPPEALAEIRAEAELLRDRRGFFGETVVMALAGGTGSGKSSLLNAVAGERVTSVSHVRPHTDRPLGWVPDEAETGLRELLGDLGVHDVVEQEVVDGVALVDLPDMDSIEAWHRATVERLLPRVDAVIWVMDPEKYRDRVLHDDFLAPLAGYGEQFLFVMNKVDRLRPAERELVATDLRDVLTGHGYHDPPIFLTAADPMEGPPVGIETFAAHLREQVDAKRLATVKLLEDADRLLRRLGAAAGVWRGTEMEFPRRWRKVRDDVAADLARGGRSATEDALWQLEDLVAAVAIEAGEVLGGELRDRFPGVRLMELVEAATEAGSAGGRGHRWWGRSQTAPDVDAIAQHLDAEFGEPLRDVLWRRSRLGATIAFAFVGARQLRAGLLAALPSPEETAGPPVPLGADDTDGIGGGDDLET